MVARMLRRLLLLALIALPATAGAQNVAPPTEAELAVITTRGRLLAAYDYASWHGTDAVLAKWKEPAGVEGFLARQGQDGRWYVLFGRLNAASDSLLVAARADQASNLDSFSPTIHPTPVLGSDVERRMFRAMRTAGADLKTIPPPHNGTYNSYVLAGKDGGWLVYFLPGQTQPNAIPHGGDFRYEVSADGATIQSRFAMHRGVINLWLPPDAVAGMHTVIVADRPQESDVFLVLSRKPAKPELVGTAHFNFEIATDGTISWRSNGK